MQPVLLASISSLVNKASFSVSTWCFHAADYLFCSIPHALSTDKDLLRKR